MAAAKNRSASAKGAAVDREEPRSFYDSALSEAERVSLPQAREIEGLEEEIALLRVKLKSAVAQHPENMTLVLKGIAMIIRAVATKYRLSKRAKENLTDAIDSVLKEIGSALYPEAFSQSED